MTNCRAVCTDKQPVGNAVLTISPLLVQERLKVTEHRPETEDKADKRNTDPKSHLSSMSSTSPLLVMHPHKRRPPSHSPTPSTSSLAPLPNPSTVTALKSEDSGTRALPHPPTPLAHPASPRSASPPPSSPRQPKQEAAEEGDMGQREQRGAQKPASGPFQGMYSGEGGENDKRGNHSTSNPHYQIRKGMRDIFTLSTTDSCISFIDPSDLPPGYPFQSITAPFGSALSPYHMSAPAAATADVVPVHRSRSPLSSASLPSAHLHSRLLDTDVKPQKLELSKMYLKQETGAVPRRHDVAPEPPTPIYRSGSPVLAKRDREDSGDVAKPQLPPLQVSSPPQQRCERLEDVRKEEKEGGQIKVEVPSYSCKASYPLPPLTEAEPQSEVIRAQERYLPWTTADPHTQESAVISQEQTSTSACAEQQPDAAINLLTPSQRETGRESPATSPPVSNSTLPVPEDPMAGMFALLTASEMARAHPCSPAPMLTTPIETSPVPPDCSSTGALEIVALEGMALLSQVAQQELEPLGQDQGGLVVLVMMMFFNLILIFP